MRARLGVNNCFAVKRWPRPDDWAQIVRGELGLDIVELSLDLVEDIDSPGGRERAAGQIRSALGRHGLRAETVFTGLAAYSLNLLIHPDDTRRRAAVDWYEEVVDLAARVGARGAGGHVGAEDVLLVLEVIPAFEQDDEQVLAELRTSAELWKAALTERGMR